MTDVEAAAASLEATFSVRIAEGPDVMLAYAIMRAAFAESAAFDNPSSALEERYDEFLAATEAGGAIVAFVDGRPAGSGRFAIDEEAGHLGFSRLAVLPALRERGLGGAMIRFLEEHARSLGLAEVRADARSQQPDNRRYYLDRGYEIIGYAERYGIPDIRTHLAKAL